MSTGDQSEYLRKKMAERRISSALGPQPVFMKSGFQRWAENERPTRMGGAEKEAMEVSRDGGGNLLTKIQKTTHAMFQPFYEYEGGAHYQSGKSECESDEESVLDEGGRVDFLFPIKKGNGYSGNGSLYQPGQSHSVQAASKRAEMMANGSGMLSEHAMDLMEMAKKGGVVDMTGYVNPYQNTSRARQIKREKEATGNGKLECIHYEDGEGTHVRKGGIGMDDRLGDEVDDYARQYINELKQSGVSAKKGTCKTNMFAKARDCCDDVILMNKVRQLLTYDDTANTVREKVKRVLMEQECGVKGGRISSKIRTSEASIEGAEGMVEQRGSGIPKVMKHGKHWIVGEKEGKELKVHGGPFESKEEAQQYLEAAIILIKASKDKPKKEGKGYKEGIQHSKKAFDAIGDVAISGLDAYEKGTSGDVFGAMDEVKKGYSASLRAKDAIEDASKQFKGGREVGAGKKRSSARAQIVKRIMKEKGLSLPQASKYVKEHGLYKS